MAAARQGEGAGGRRDVSRRGRKALPAWPREAAGMRRCAEESAAPGPRNTTACGRMEAGSSTGPGKAAAFPGRAGQAQPGTSPPLLGLPLRRARFRTGGFGDARGVRGNAAVGRWAVEERPQRTRGGIAMNHGEKKKKKISPIDFWPAVSYSNMLSKLRRGLSKCSSRDVCTADNN